VPQIESSSRLWRRSLFKARLSQTGLSELVLGVLICQLIMRDLLLAAISLADWI
jgi:hypothetical protein